jgi:hypothetical protein
LTLQDRAGKCHLAVVSEGSESLELPMTIPWPCEFHRDMTGAIRTIRENDAIFALIESSERTGPKDCESFVQAVKIVAAKVEVSSHHDRLASCPPFQWDKMLFTELFN